MMEAWYRSSLVPIYYTGDLSLATCGSNKTYLVHMSYAGVLRNSAANMLAYVQQYAQCLREYYWQGTSNPETFPTKRPVRGLPG
eukprot:scaffold108508_cov20-Prasinocladus_malaysianus.AAC.1